MIGECVLYTGCRHRAQDFIYEDELEEFQRNGTLTTLHTAFSRDQPTKVYVQHLMRGHADALWKLLQEGAHVYICGDAKRMAVDVLACFYDIIAEKGGKTREQAVDHMKKLAKRGRYNADVWS